MKWRLKPMWKKSSILLCVMTLIIASIFAGAGTLAYFSGETFTLDFSSPTVEPVISGLNPGETMHIVIIIPNPHYASILAQIRLLNVLYEENGVVEPEQEWYNLHGERNDIDAAITFGLWIDKDGDTSSCSSSDVWVKDVKEGRHVSDIKEEVIPLGKIPAMSSIVVVSSYHMDEETPNWAQSDTMTFDIDYTLSSLGAPGHKQEAIEELKEGKTGIKKIDEKIDKAIYHIERSLDEKYWVDDNHLCSDPKQGKKVFEEEMKAVKELKKLMDNEDTLESVKDLCQSTIYKLIEADSTLAHTAYEDALDFAGDPKVDEELEKCEEKLDKIDEELAKSNYEKAIEHSKKAWEHAQKALKHASEG